MSHRQPYLPDTPSVQIDDFPDNDHRIGSSSLRVVSSSTSTSSTAQQQLDFGNPPPPLTLHSKSSRDSLDYPPPPNSGGGSRHSSHSHSRSSIHLPLIGVGDDSLDDDRPNQPLAWQQSGSRWSQLFSMRGRLHPLALIPACLFGVLLSMSGLFGHRTIGRQTFGLSAPDPMKALYLSHPTGHLFLNPASIQHRDSVWGSQTSAPPPVRHPIHDLIANATTQWEKKLGRQSRTLEQAVKEYKKRNGRKPPKGFDDWFKFAQLNDVILIDEFDNISRDLKPFWALPPSIINERALSLQKEPWTFTMEIRKGEVTISGAHKTDGRADDQKALMKRWTKWVSDIDITMASHDGPSIMIDWDMKQRHLKAADEGSYLAPEWINNLTDPAHWGFFLACPPNSRLRRQAKGLETAALPIGPSFVEDHLRTMDMCENPEWQYLHGFTSWAGMKPKLLQPLFSMSATSVYSDIRLTPLEQYWNSEPWDPEWKDKPNNKAVWRGSTTGVWFDRTTWWKSSQRVRLWFLSKDQTGSQLVRFDGKGVESKKGIESIAERKVSNKELMERYVDFAFTGKAGQCDEQDGSCDLVKQTFDFQPALGWNQANEYKYLLDLDGNAWSGRFHRLLSSNSAVLKSTIFPEWYSDWIQPWVHYIPVKVDYTDLFDIMAFFSGDLEGNNAHEESAMQIAAAGKDYTARFWRYQDMEAYFFRLCLEWARLTADDRSKMDYDGPGA